MVTLRERVMAVQRVRKAIETCQSWVWGDHRLPKPKLSPRPTRLRRLFSYQIEHRCCQGFQFFGELLIFSPSSVAVYLQQQIEKKSVSQATFAELDR